MIVERHGIAERKLAKIRSAWRQLPEYSCNAHAVLGEAQTNDIKTKKILIRWGKPLGRLVACSWKFGNLDIPIHGDGCADGA